MRSRIYVGELSHARLEPVAHAFRYPTWMVMLDLDELSLLDRDLWLFGHNRRRPVSLHDRDYLGDPDGTLRHKLEQRLDSLGFAGPSPGRIELLTTPRVLGHTFNPVSFWFCYAEPEPPRRQPRAVAAPPTGMATAASAPAHAALVGVVAEVNNTFGEGHLYLLDPHNARGPDRFCADKRFHVSPFHDMTGIYEFRVPPPARRLDIGIDIRRRERATFVSRLRGTARPLTDRSLAGVLARQPLATVLTLPRILWQALRLHYGKRLPVHPKPQPSSPATFVSTYPPYLSEFRTPTWLQRQSKRFANGAVGGEEPSER